MVTFLARVSGIHERAEIAASTLIEFWNTMTLKTTMLEFSEMPN